MSKDEKRCLLCNREFGFTLWRYQCAVCKQTFCDDCTPNKYRISPDASDEKVCKKCEKERVSVLHTADGGRRLGGGQAASNTNVEREKIAQLAESRSRGSVKPAKSQTASNPKLEAPAPSGAKEHAEVEQRSVSSGHKLGGNPSPPPLGSDSSETTNPVLAAALRRQQQSTVGVAGKRGGDGPADVEKQQLLVEICALLKSRNEEEPFGLRAMDATKLRLFLRHLQHK